MSTIKQLRIINIYILIYTKVILNMVNLYKLILPQQFVC